jgi:fatty acid CoA ligase FadD9
MYEDFQRELHQYRLKNNTIIDEHCEDPDEAQNKDEERFLRDLYSKYFEMVGGNVRSVVTGGASTSVAVLRFLNHVFEWPCGVYDGYGATETGAIMINNAIVSTVEFKIVDVPEMGYYQTDIPKPRGELCVKTTSMFTGYINDETQTSNAMDSDGYVHTGDIVEHLGGRNCRIIDRKKNILKLAQGEFVAPEAIENTLVESLFVSQVYVYGSTVRSFVLAVVVPNWRIVKEWNTELDIDDEKIVTNPIVKAKIMEEIVLVGKRKKLAQYQIPRDVILQRQDFKHETGQLTSIGKIARFNCEKIYKERLENLYEELEQSKRGDISNFIHGVMGQGTDAEESQIDSLHAVRIASIIKTKYNIEVDAKTILGNGTVNGITDLILKGGTSAPKKMYNWEEELALEIQVPPKAVPTSEMLQLHGDILLTGSTGFLGAFLLDTLLTTTNCRIHCIVRAGQVTPIERIKSTMEYHKRILPQDFEHRVIAYNGDLSQERLGLDEQTFSRLCETIRIIYHNGAHVNSLFTYEKLKAENVASTREIIKMATTGPLKVIHYTSTISVVRNFVTRRITEDVDENETQDQLFHRLDTMGGYAATKYVAEKLLRKARDAGVPVTIYRPGMIGHDRVTGCCNMTDWVNRFILACIHVGMYPITRARLNAVPVDQVASIIVQASQMESSLEQCYHIVNDVENELNFNLMMQFVPNLTVIEFRGWMKMVDSMLEHNQSGPIYDALWPMIGLFKHGFPEPGTPVGNDRLEKIGVTLKPLTKEDVQQQVSFIIANCKINGETS